MGIAGTQPEIEKEKKKSLAKYKSPESQLDITIVEGKSMFDFHLWHKRALVGAILAVFFNLLYFSFDRSVPVYFFILNVFVCAVAGFVAYPHKIFLLLEQPSKSRPSR